MPGAVRPFSLAAHAPQARQATDRAEDSERFLCEYV
jgi:hypothetical protein